MEIQFIETNINRMTANIDIKKISIKELSEFIDSDFFKNLNTKPVSPDRALSYINNPRSVPNDPVVYMLLLNKELVCFRTVIPDFIYKNDEKEKIAWLSGSFTKINYRRKGYSKLLLDEIIKDYNQKIIYTNYAPESHLLYSNSGKFKIVTERKGRRFYGKININDFIKKKSFFMMLIKPFSNLLISIFARFKRATYHTDRSIKIEEHKKQLPKNFIKNIQNRQSLFNREQKDFEWIFNFPWLTTNKEYFNYDYPFSFYTNDFKYHFLHVSKQNDNAWLILMERESSIKLSYYSCTNIKLAAKAILDLCYTTKAKTLTILDRELSQEIIAHKMPFIYHKPFHMGIYASFPIENPGQYQFQDGDGDYIFT